LVEKELELDCATRFSWRNGKRYTLELQCRWERRVCGSCGVYAEPV